jgi:NAD(P)-dependent dehydrogenase (short-subunit alcohol dehydrogenase family)
MALTGPDMAGKRVLVTGGASGIGAAIVRHLTAAGARGAICDVNPCPPGAVPEGWTQLSADVRDEASVSQAFAEATAAFGKLDVVVPAAGVVPGWESVVEMDLQKWDDVFAVNARGVAATVKHAAQAMTDGGAVVVIASMNAWRGDPNIVGYVASKHAVLGLVRSAALDLGARGIRVNAVGPGPVATDALIGRISGREQEGGTPLEQVMAAMAAETALRRIATADDIAKAVLFLGSDMASGMSGQLLHVDGGVL